MNFRNGGISCSTSSVELESENVYVSVCAYVSVKVFWQPGDFVLNNKGFAMYSSELAEVKKCKQTRKIEVCLYLEMFFSFFENFDFFGLETSFFSLKSFEAA